MSRIITMAMLKRALHESHDFDSFAQAIVNTVIARSIALTGKCLSPDDCEKFVNLFYDQYPKHYADLVAAGI